MWGGCADFDLSYRSTSWKLESLAIKYHLKCTLACHHLAQLCHSIHQLQTLSRATVVDHTSCRQECETASEQHTPILPPESLSGPATNCKDEMRAGFARLLQGEDDFPFLTATHVQHDFKSLKGGNQLVALVENPSWATSKTRCHCFMCTQWNKRLQSLYLGN
eukprot:4876349-Amphidinium_carterae.1